MINFLNEDEILNQDETTLTIFDKDKNSHIENSEIIDYVMKKKLYLKKKLPSLDEIRKMIKRQKK